MNARCASLLFVLAIAPGPAAARSESIAERFETVDGMRLHYLTAGSGPVVVLLHGYAQTSRMWRPFVPPIVPWTARGPKVLRPSPSQGPSRQPRQREIQERVRAELQKAGCEAEEPRPSC